MYKIYQVGDNETLEDIANKLRVSEEEIRRLNGFNPNYQVSKDQYIIIPSMDNGLFENYIIQKDDTIYGIGQKFGISPKNLLKINGLNADDYIYPGETLLIPRNNIQFYITEEGDTLESVVGKLDTSIEDIMEYNQKMTLMPEQLNIIKKEEMR